MLIKQCPLCGQPMDPLEAIELTRDEIIKADLPDNSEVCYDCYVAIDGCNEFMEVA